MSERTPLLGDGHAADSDEAPAQTFDRADLKSLPVTLLTIASLVLATLCLAMTAALKIGFDLAVPTNPYYGYNRHVYLAITVAFTALPIFILDILNLASVRRHGRTISTAINIIADGLVIVFVLSRLVWEGSIPKIENLSQMCRIHAPPPYNPGPPYRPGPPQPDPWDRNCMNWLHTLVIFIWIFEVSALLFGLVHVALFVIRAIRLNATRHLRPRNAWLPVSQWGVSFQINTQRQAPST